MPKSILYATSYKLTDKLSIQIPTVGQVLDNEDAYYSLVTALTAMPIDFMVQLDDIGIDFTTLSAYDLFLLLFPSLQKDDASLIFGDLDLSKFEFAKDERTNSLCLLDKENDIKIDRGVHAEIAAVLRKINHLEKNRRKPGNGEAKKYMIERARIKQKRAMQKRKGFRVSQLEELIVALVNAKEFKYNFETVRDLTIFQFNSSLHQILRRISYDYTMLGCYVGTLKAKELDQSEFNWLTSSK